MCEPDFFLSGKFDLAHIYIYIYIYIYIPTWSRIACARTLSDTGSPGWVPGLFPCLNGVREKRGQTSYFLSVARNLISAANSIALARRRRGAAAVSARLAKFTLMHARNSVEYRV